MADDLDRRIRLGEDLGDARSFLDKDMLRAAVDLFIAARADGNPDALWLGERVVELAGYAWEFDDYPTEWQDKIHRAVEETQLAFA